MTQPSIRCSCLPRWSTLLTVAALLLAGAATIPVQAGTILVPTWASAEADATFRLAWGDWDNDGDLDLVVGNEGGPARVYENDGLGTASSLLLVWSSAGLTNTYGVGWGDWDKDGDLDLAVGTDSSNVVYANDGLGLATSLTQVWSSTETDVTASVAWADWDGDGDLDLAAGNYGTPSRIYDNDGLGTANSLSLAWSSSFTTDSTLAVAWGDWDDDGDPDLAVANEVEPVRVYENDGLGTATSLAAVWASSSTGTQDVAWGDWDGDGDSDLASAFFGTNPNRVYANDGLGTASSLTVAWTSTELDDSRDVDWGDMNGDGILDLAVGNFDSPAPNARIYVNDGLGTGTSLTLEWSSAEAMPGTLGIALADWDNDGDLDLATGNNDLSSTGRVNRVYENLAAGSQSMGRNQVVLGMRHGAAPGVVTLEWSGCFAPSSVYRADSPANVTDPGNLLGQTSAFIWDDASPAGDLFHYNVNGSCIATFRFSDLLLRDPHVFLDLPVLGCLDFTDTAPLGLTSSFNEFIAEAMTTGSNGFLDLSYVLSFCPLDRVSTNGDLGLGLAECTAPVAGTTCEAIPGKPPSLAPYDNLESGICLSPYPGTTLPYSPAVGEPGGPCFSSDLLSVDFLFSTVLEDAQVAATYSGLPPSTSIGEGLLRGFLSEAEADATFVDFGIGPVALSAMLPGGAGSCAGYSDLDVGLDGVTPGWWLYLNFTAAEVVSVPMCVPNPEVCDDGLDNDMDGNADCLDADCNGVRACEFGAELSCDDFLDNDSDGLADCLDQDCDGLTGCEFATEVSCTDGFDNDADGKGDCLDADCVAAPECALRDTGFRFSELLLRDPHVFLDLPVFGCSDFTDTAPLGLDYSFNDLITQSMTTGSDGFLDLSYVLSFCPLDRVSTNGGLGLGLAECTAPVAGTTCQAIPGKPPSLAPYDNLESGICLSPYPGTTLPYSPAVGEPAGPCFSSDLLAVDFLFSTMLEDAQVAATYFGLPPSTSIGEGLLRGFLSEAEADATFVDFGTGPVALSEMLPGGTGNCAGYSDLDVGLDGVTPGWWLYLNFTAAEVVSVPMCVPNPEVCDDGLDNDADGNADCLDADCNGVRVCEFGVELSCDDSLDNDGDGLADCLDQDCNGLTGCEFGTELSCTDGLDNDGDSWIDCVDDDCNGNPECASKSYRFTELTLRDPHMFLDLALLGCYDFTDDPPLSAPSFNDLLAEGLVTASGEFLDLSLVLSFCPLDQLAPSGNMGFGNANCTPPAGSTSCAVVPEDPPDVSGYANSAAGSCLMPYPGTARPYSPAIAEPNGPCFMSGFVSIDLPFKIDLQDVEVAAKYVGLPASSLVQGLLRGFLAEAHADASNVNFGTGSMPLSSFLSGGTGACSGHDDRDVGLDGVTSGWWFYFNFIAEEVVSEPMCVPNSEACRDGVDNDDDLLVDCLDPDCDGVSGCEYGVEITCEDTRDNDGDGLADCLDPDCSGSAGC